MEIMTPADLIAVTGALFDGFPTDSVAVHLIVDQRPLGMFRCDKQVLNSSPHLSLSKIVGESHPDKAIIVGFNAEQHQLDTMELWLRERSVGVEAVLNVLEDEFVDARSGSRYPMTEVYISDFYGRDFQKMKASGESIVNGAWINAELNEERVQERIKALLKTLDATDEPLDEEAVNEALPLALFNVQHRDLLLVAAATGYVPSIKTMDAVGKFIIEKSQDYSADRVLRFREALHHVLAQTPRFQKPAFLTLLGWTYLYQGQYAHAAEMVAEALEIDSGYRLAQLLLAWLLIQS